MKGSERIDMPKPETTESEITEPGEATLHVNVREAGQLTADQHDFLMMPLKSTRVASRRQGGKSLSYLESWDVRAHLTRIFGFGNWDAQTVREKYIGRHDYTSTGDNPKPMMEVIWQATVTLTVRDRDGRVVATHTEGAVGNATGSVAGSGAGDLHDNALKQAASDALKRCAINFGTQFGLSLYNNGARTDVVRTTLVYPEGATLGLPPKRNDEQIDGAAQQRLSDSLGVTVIGGGDHEDTSYTATDDPA